MSEFCLNKIELLGRVGRDAETRYTEDGSLNITNFSLATSRSFKDNAGNWKEETEWHRVACFKTVADYAAKLKKGNRVYVSGRVRTRKYTDKNGVEKYVVEVVADVVKLVEFVKTDETQSQAAPSQAPTNTDDDVPF